ncbi:MAG: HEAT repeat domain-containing protein, partial [Phycisphaerae bacterium]
MKGLTTSILLLSLIGPAAAQPARSTSVSEVALIQEFKGLAKPVARAPEALQGEYARAVKYLLARMADRNTSSRRRLEGQGDLEAICLRAGRPGAEAERAALCMALLPFLEGGAAEASRETVVRMLEYVGRAESVEALGKLLDGADKKVREKARRALQNNPSPEAAERLRQALYRAAEPQWKVALINALGYRRDAASVEWLGKALKGKDEPTAMAAAAALGKIGGPKAIEALNDVRLLALPRLRAEITGALFACADRAAAGGDKETATTIYRKAYENPNEPKQNRIAALRSMVVVEPDRALPVILTLLSGTDEAIIPVAMDLAREIPGRAATKAFAAMVSTVVSPTKKVALIELLGARGDPAGREAVVDALKGRKWQKETREAVRLAVIKALGGVGNEEDVLMLAGLAAQTIKGKEEEQ